MEHGIARLLRFAGKAYAQDRWAVLVILQAMDAAGKDSTIKHVMSGLNPPGLQRDFVSRRPPRRIWTTDFLWRATRSLPARGKIGIFNRSYYEEVLVARVHPEILSRGEIAARFGLRKNLAGAF